MQAIKYLFITMMIVLLQSCSNEPTVKDAHLEKIELRSLSSTLYYSGTIEPLRSVVIPSPADGVVLEMPIQYGQDVEAGNLLFMVSSAKFLTDYKQALMQYIKAKNDFNNSKAQLSESEFLHKNQLISEDDFKMKKSSYYSNRLVLLQAKDALQNLLNQLAIKNVDLYQLKIADIDKITKAMHLQKNSENLRILSTASGVLLAPTKSNDDTKKVLKGDNVKQGDVLAVIGDMSGISVRIKVNELTVNQLTVGQVVSVTGIAFSDYNLQGKITRIDKQGESSASGIPSFDVEVDVVKLSKAQQQAIHVGMSAKVTINMSEDARIMIPVAALLEKNGASFVKALDKSSGKITEVLIQTGKSTPDSVAVLSGLKVGDKIVVPNQA
jgi:multidrug efflux pump subunit AcrA (membrane-fusion protein)